MKKKYLFLYLKTGGGHISTAKALERYFSKNYGKETEIILKDGFHEAGKIIKSIIVDGYATAQTYAQTMYEFLYFCNKRYPVAKAHQLLISLFTKPYIKKLITQKKPDKIVIFHFFLIKPVLQALEELGVDIPVVTVVTDPFTGTRIRFMEKNMQYIVYSERMKKYAVSLGVSKKNIKVYPPIIHEKFLTRATLKDIRTIKNSLNIPMDKKIILLLGGGDGLPKSKNILMHLAQSGTDAHIIIVCGKNKAFLQQAKEIKKEYPHLSLQIHGFVDFTHDLIHISDIVISKSGPATLFEILLCGKIPFINSYMREQEKGNVEFVVDNHVGIYEKNIEKLVHKAQKMLDKDLSKYQRAIQKLNLRIGTKEIAEYIRSF